MTTVFNLEYMPTHFHRGDERFCGTKKARRRFTADPNKVSCPQCQDNDRLQLTPQGAAFAAPRSRPPVSQEAADVLAAIARADRKAAQPPRSEA